MLSNPFADSFASSFYLLDSKCRDDLSRSLITSERDYVATLTGRIRDFIPEAYKVNTLAKSLNASDERKFGCDAMLVFHFKGEIKIGMFESKWPRYFTQRNYQWDRVYDTTGKSHFSSQIERQLNWTKSIAIWEMFMNEESPGKLIKPFDTYGSTCIPFFDIDEHMHKNRLLTKAWCNSDLLTVAKKNKSLKSIIKDILICRRGKLIKLNNNRAEINGFQENIVIPIVLPQTIDFNQGRIISDSYSFNELEKLGIKNYTCFDFAENFVGEYEDLK